MAGVSLLTGVAARYSPPDTVRLEVGAFPGGYLDGPWSAAIRADVDPPATEDGRTVFFYRTASTRSRIVLPFLASGDVRFTLRARAAVQGIVGLVAGGRPAAQLLVRGLWREWSEAIPHDLIEGRPLDVTLALRPIPLVRGEHAGGPELQLDYVEVASPRGLLLAAEECALLAAVPLAIFAFGLAVGSGLPRVAIAGGVASCLALILLVHTAPLPLLLAVPRLLPVALLAGLAAQRLLRRSAAATPGDATGLAWLLAAGVLCYGALAFFPNHNPPGLDPHVRRALAVGGVPFSYRAWLEYGSQLSAVGEAMVTFGHGPLIPYSPLPFAFYYAIRLLGVDLYWGMTVSNVVLAMAVAPWLWVVAAGLWSRRAAWLAVALYALDLAIWFRVGRAHAPGAFGGALATAALLYLASRAGAIDTTRRALVAGAMLGVAVLGYTSLVVLIGLFGLVLLLFLVTDTREWSPAARRGVAAALVVGGLVAGGLYYFHYVPGLVQGAGSLEAGVDPFPGRTFFVFHNESRQSMWIWMLGFRFVLPLGLVAAPFALRTLRTPAGPILTSWLFSWALVMLLKEPFLFPKLLRWAKEDQFVSPLLCLFVAAAVDALPRPWMRWAAGSLAVAGALALQVRAYAYLADSLLV